MKNRFVNIIASVVSLFKSTGLKAGHYPDPPMREYRGKLGRSRVRHSRKAMIRMQHAAEAARRGGPGKINYRRSDPRHPMYNVFRRSGLKVLWKTPAGGVLIKDGEGEAHDPIDAFRAAGLAVPKCFV